MKMLSAILGLAFAANFSTGNLFAATPHTMPVNAEVKLSSDVPTLPSCPHSYYSSYDKMTGEIVDKFTVVTSGEYLLYEKSRSTSNGKLACKMGPEMGDAQFTLDYGRSANCDTNMKVTPFDGINNSIWKGKILSASTVLWDLTKEDKSTRKVTCEYKMHNGTDAHMKWKNK